MKVISHSLLCFDQNDRSDSTSSTSLSHSNRGAADLSASVGLLVLSACNTLHSVLATHYTVHAFPVITQKFTSNLASLKF